MPIDERLIVVYRCPFDLPDENRMVAARVWIYQTAFQIRQNIFQNRQVVNSQMIFSFCKLVGQIWSKTVGNILLVFAQEVDDEWTALFKSVMTAGVFFDANQDERRLQRYRTKCADRYSVQASVRVSGSNNRYAAGKASECAAKFPFTDWYKLRIKLLGI